MPLRRLFQRLSAAVLLVGLSTAVGEAQTCVQMAEFDSMAAGVIRMVRSYTTPADSAYNAYRIGLGYPLVAASQVTLVSKEQDCKKARDEFNAKLPTGTGRTNRVVVVKAGSTYTVIDPATSLTHRRHAGPTCL
jgi:hypothetical protein